MIYSKKLLFLLLYTLLSGLTALGVYGFFYKQNLDQLEISGSVSLNQARDRILGQMASYRQLSNILAKHPTVTSALRTREVQTDLNDFLLNTSLLYGASDIFILDIDGNSLASSTPFEGTGLASNNFKAASYFKVALNGRLGVYHALSKDGLKRFFFFARDILDDDNVRTGAAVVVVDVATLEFEWQIDERALAFWDNDGVVFVTNRQSLKLLKNEQYNDIKTSPQRNYGNQLNSFFDHEKNIWFGHEIWKYAKPNTLPNETKVMFQFIPQLEMNSQVFLDVRPAKSTALLYSLFACAAFLMAGLGIWIFAERRERLTKQLALEEEANAKLEVRVKERSEQLKRTQQQLVSASKLTALGQMSAGISHEVNQPLAAIRNFADNGEKLLKLDRKTDAQDNFARIKEQIDRISKIIKGLRAFSRKEKEEIEPVDIVKIVQDSLQISQARLLEEKVELVTDLPSEPIMVFGGHIRLQQVIINILTNAIDALQTQASREIKIALKQGTKTHVLKITDNGHGISDLDRAFEPFYSTKEIGSSQGLGLGLSISHGIVGSFGGELTCANMNGGGAEFSITLRSASKDSSL